MTTTEAILNKSIHGEYLHRRWSPQYPLDSIYEVFYLDLLNSVTNRHYTELPIVRPLIVLSSVTINGTKIIPYYLLPVIVTGNVTFDIDNVDCEAAMNHQFVVDEYSTTAIHPVNINHRYSSDTRIQIQGRMAGYCSILYCDGDPEDANMKISYINMTHSKLQFMVKKKYGKPFTCNHNAESNSILNSGIPREILKDSKPESLRIYGSSDATKGPVVIGSDGSIRANSSPGSIIQPFVNLNKSMNNVMSNKRLVGGLLGSLSI